MTHTDKSTTSWIISKTELQPTISQIRNTV